MAEELRKNFQVEPEMVEGSGGIFDVTVDGKRVYSKGEMGRFPRAGEVTEILRKMRR